MSVHTQGRGCHRVRWRDDDDINRSRTFRRKADAERFDRKITARKAEAREKGYVTITQGLDPNDPDAVSQLTGDLAHLLKALYPEYVFIVSHEDPGPEELPLNGAISWNAKPLVEARREAQLQSDWWDELGRRHPEILGSDGTVDHSKSTEITAAIEAERDTLPEPVVSWAASAGRSGPGQAV